MAQGTLIPEINVFQLQSFMAGGCKLIRVGVVQPKSMGLFLHTSLQNEVQRTEMLLTLEVSVVGVSVLFKLM